MKRYQVIVAPIVIEQIRSQVFHIARDSIDNALAWEARLSKAIENLSDTPGLAIDEAATARLGYQVRKYVFEQTYLVHFIADDAERIVRVVDFRHGMRLPARGEP